MERNKPSQPGLFFYLSFYGVYAFLISSVVLCINFFQELGRSHSLHQATWWTFTNDPVPIVITTIIFLIAIPQFPKAMKALFLGLWTGVGKLGRLIWRVLANPLQATARKDPKPKMGK